MKKITTIAAVAFLFLSPAAIAQQANPAPEEVEVSVDWGHLQQSVGKLIQMNAALRQKLTDMDAYLKKCGDKPGCTVPVEPTPAPDKK